MALSVQNVLYLTDTAPQFISRYHTHTLSLCVNTMSSTNMAPATLLSTLNVDELYSFCHFPQSVNSFSRALRDITSQKFPATELPWCYILHCWFSWDPPTKRDHTSREIFLYDVIEYLLSEKIISSATLMPKRSGSYIDQVCNGDLVPLYEVLFTCGDSGYGSTRSSELCEYLFRLFEEVEGPEFLENVRRMQASTSASPPPSPPPSTMSSNRGTLARSTLDVDELYGLCHFAQNMDELEEVLEKITSQKFPAAELPWCYILHCWFSSTLEPRFEKEQRRDFLCNAVLYLLSEGIIVPTTLMPRRRGFYADQVREGGDLAPLCEVVHGCGAQQHGDPQLFENMRWMLTGRLLVLGNRDPRSPLCKLPDDMIYMIGGML